MVTSTFGEVDDPTPFRNQLVLESAIPRRTGNRQKKLAAVSGFDPGIQSTS